MTSSDSPGQTRPDGRTRTASLLRAVRFLPLWFMAAIVLVTYVVIGWTLRRGFDWTDESFVYTLIASNRQSVGEAWGFQHLLHPLYVLTGESVLAFRVLRLAGYVLLGVFLVWAARFVVRRMGISIPRSGWVFILLLAQAGTFLAWSFPPRYLGYNELASWFSQLGVALILISLAWGSTSPRESSPVPEASVVPDGSVAAEDSVVPDGSVAAEASAVPGASAAENVSSPPEPSAVPKESSPPDQPAVWVLWAIWAALGGLTTLLVFAKVTSAVAFGAILALAILVPNPSLRLWKRLLSVIAGAGSTLLMLWVVGAPIGFYLRNGYSLVFDKSVRAAFGHPTAGMIATYSNSAHYTGRDVFLVVLLFALAMAAFRWKSRPVRDTPGGRAVDGVTWLLGALLVLALFTLPRPDLWSYLGELVAFIGAAGLIGLAMLGVDRARLRATTLSRTAAVVVGGVAIMAVPVISAVGTANRLAGQFLWTATLWAVVLGVALVLLTRRAAGLRSRARALPVLIGCAVLVLSSLAVRADIAKPYRSAPLVSLHTATSVPALRGILVSRSDAEYIDWISSAGVSLRAEHVPAIVINPFRRQQSYVGLGALYAFNHSGYANPWLGRDWPAAFNSLRLACAKDRPKDLFVLQPGLSGFRTPSTAGVTKNLAACGISFPGDFRLVATHRSADPGRMMRIWRLR